MALKNHNQDSNLIHAFLHTPIFHFHHDQYGQLTSEAFDSDKDGTTQCYFCRIGDDVRDGRETWDNPLYSAYQNHCPVSSGLWDKQRGRWVLGVEIYVVLHDHKFYWCQQRPDFSTFLNFPCEKARSDDLVCTEGIRACKESNCTIHRDRLFDRPSSSSHSLQIHSLSKTSIIPRWSVIVAEMEIHG